MLRLLFLFIVADVADVAIHTYKPGTREQAGCDDDVMMM